MATAPAWPLPSESGPVPGRVLWALAVLVLLAHAVVLRQLPMGQDARTSLKTRVFTTRSMQMATMAAPAVRQPQPPVSATPRPGPKRRSPPPRQEGVMAAATRVARGAVPEPGPVTEPALRMQPDAASVAPNEPLQASDPTTRAAVATEAAPPVATPAALPVSAPLASPDAQAPAVVQADSMPATTAEPVIDKPPASAPAVAGDQRPPSLAYTIPGSIRLRFDATGKRGRLDYRALGTLTWLHDGTEYDARLEMGDWIIGTRVLSSVGKLTADGLAPRRFSDKFRSERAAHFDRQQGRIVFSANTPTLPLLPGTQDQISIFVQLAALVAGDPLGFPIGKTVNIPTVGPRDAEAWAFEVEKEEMLHLPGGEVPTLKLVRRPAKDYSQTVELWLAPELAYLPARIRISFANGDYIDQQWRSSSPP